MSYIKIHPGKIKYFVNKDRKTVTAVIVNCKYDFYRFIEKKVDRQDRWYIHKTPDGYLNDTYMGIATCKDSDDFDITMGKEIARRKAVRKYRNAICNTWHRYVYAAGTAFAKVGQMLEEDYITADNSYNITMRKALEVDE